MYFLDKHIFRKMVNFKIQNTMKCALLFILAFVFLTSGQLNSTNEYRLNVLSDISRATNDLWNIIKKQKEEVKDIRTGVEELERRSYAFTVKLGSKKEVADGRRLVFDQEDSNSSDAFDHVQSAFVCQENGVYFFHAMICCQRAKSARYQIVRNSREVLGFIYTQDAINNDCAGNGVTTSLRTGDTVWLRSRFNSFTDSNTYFTGFKVQ